MASALTDLTTREIEKAEEASPALKMTKLAQRASENDDRIEVLEGYSLTKNATAAVAPTDDDDTGDDYAVGSQWTDTVTEKVYICTDASSGAAVWKEITFV